MGYTKNMNTSHTLRIIAGSAVILLGAAVLLDNLQLFNFGQLLATWWPLIVIGIGLYNLFTRPQLSVWPVALIIVGAALQLRQLGVIDFSLWQLFWPFVLIAIGVSIITGARRRKTSVTPGNDSNLSAILSGVTTKSTSTDYKGGSITAVMGSVELDLRDADIKKEATIDVFALMGGVEIRVPEHWVVRSEATAILGGAENKTKAAEKKSAPILTITGTVSLGGVEVRN